jgi:hypothetical protein
VILEEIRQIQSGKRELRQFGFTMGIVLGLLGGWFLYRGREHAIYWLIAAGLFLLLGAVLPAALKPLQKAWMALAVVLGWVMTRIILGALFYLVVTPVGLIGRLCGKRFLETRFREETVQSYWLKRESKIRREDCERQF